MRELLPIIDGDFLFSNLLLITFILYPILSILTLLAHQALLASLLGIINNIDSYNIVLNLTQLFNISTGIRECPGNIVVKDIKSIPPLKPRLLKLLISNKKLFKDRKAYVNITTALSMYILITKIKGIGSNTMCFIISL